MGIPAYFSFIIRAYPHIRRRALGAAPVDEFYMDCNSVIYEAFRAGGGGDVISATVARIAEIVKIVSPKALLYIAFDGTAPLAKIVQQRERRFKTAAAAAAGGDATLETLQITPGTEFMSRLMTAVKDYFMDSTKYRAGAAAVIVSGSDEAGEGEQKIFQYVRGRGARAGRAVLYGLDADLFMLSLFHKEYFDDLVVFREGSAEFPPDIIDIKRLARHIADAGAADMRQYLFMCFFLGNDFIKKLSVLNLRRTGMNILLNLARGSRGRPMVVGAGGEPPVIHWKNVGIFLSRLAEREHALMLEMFAERDEMEARECDPKSPLLHRAAEHYIAPAEAGWEVRYYMALFGIDVTTPAGRDELRAVCLNYLEALEWTLKYYTVGCPNWGWTYRHHYAPLIKDLICFIPTRAAEFVAAQPAAPVTPARQLALVFPPAAAARWITDAETRAWIEDHKEQLYMAGDDLEMSYSFATYDWECHPKLPPVWGLVH